MILIHRLTPFAIGLVSAGGFTALLRTGLPPVAIACAAALAVVLLLVRLVGWRPWDFRFWNFVGTPFVFHACALALFFFFERPAAHLALAFPVSLLLFFYAENLFAYTHLPSKYQAYSIEHLSIAMNVLTMFFAAAAGLGAGLFVQAPLPIVSAGFFLLSLFVIYGTLWVSKVEHRAALPYALAGAVLATELFAVATFLPTGYLTGAAMLALSFYLFLGLTRAHFLERLNRTVYRRYAAISILLLTVIAGTARWI